MSPIALILGLLGSLAASAFLFSGDSDDDSNTSGGSTDDEGMPPDELPDTVVDTFRSAADDGDAFNVDVAFLGDGWTEESRGEVEAAAELISDIILEDREADSVDGYGVIDDLLIKASITNLDGAGGAAAAGAPSGFSGGEPNIDGELRVDIADLSTILENDTMKAVAFHEIMHVLGFGAYYIDDNSYAENLTTNGDGDEVYRSPLSEAVLTGQEGYQEGIPLSPDLGHWSSDAYDLEIMSPTITTGTSPYIGVETLVMLEDAGFDTVLDNPLDSDDLFSSTIDADSRIPV